MSRMKVHMKITKKQLQEIIKDVVEEKSALEEICQLIFNHAQGKKGPDENTVYSVLSPFLERFEIALLLLSADTCYDIIMSLDNYAYMSRDYRYAKSEYDRTFDNLKKRLFALTNREYN